MSLFFVDIYTMMSEKGTRYNKMAIGSDNKICLTVKGILAHFRARIKLD